MAKLLNVSDDAVYRLVEDGSLPARKIGGQWRFNRVELQEWAATHGHRVSPRLFTSTDAEEEDPSLAAALERGGVHVGVPGQRRETVLAAVARLPGIPRGVDRALLEQLLVSRETLAPTAIGDGVALPHPRNPLVVRVAEPYVLLCFLAEPVDFHAMDGRPVRVLLTLLSPSVRAHLQMLARLAFVLHDDGLRALLAGTPSPEAVLARVRQLEAATPGAPPERGDPTARAGTP